MESIVKVQFTIVEVSDIFDVIFCAHTVVSWSAYEVILLDQILIHIQYIYRVKFN